MAPPRQHSTSRVGSEDSISPGWPGTTSDDSQPTAIPTAIALETRVEVDRSSPAEPRIGIPVDSRRAVERSDARRAVQHLLELMRLFEFEILNASLVALSFPNVARKLCRARHNDGRRSDPTERLDRAIGIVEDDVAGPYFADRDVVRKRSTVLGDGGRPDVAAIALLSIGASLINPPDTARNLPSRQEPLSRPLPECRRDIGRLSPSEFDRSIQVSPRERRARVH